MKFGLGAAIILALTFIGGVPAKVLHTAPHGFSVRHEAGVKLQPAEAYARFLQIGAWWSKAHTFSGDAKNLSIEAKPGGCWCETLSNGGFVRHMTVASAVPGERLVFQGGLGPLHFMGATGAMTVKFDKSGAGTKVSLTYNVAGYDPDNFQKLAGAVDGVLDQQLAAFAAVAGQ